MDNSSSSQDKQKQEQAGNWERDILEKLAMAAVTEQKAARRWGIFFKSLMFVYLLAIGGIALYPQIKAGMDLGSETKGHTAVIDIVGEISESKPANADAIINSLRDAVKDKNTRGIILHANSPGGSPVQAGYIYDEIRKIKKQHPDLPIYTVVSDICASGCYYLAAASDKIFVNQASLVGSIGVIMNGFGFVNIMDKLGVERRLLTAGEHKAMLDPFSPKKESENQFMQVLLDQVHQQFIQAVKQGRGDRLKSNEQVFSGLVWTGEEAIRIGLVDEIGNDDFVAVDIVGAKKRINFTRQERLIDRLVGKLGASFTGALESAFKPLGLH